MNMEYISVNGLEARQKELEQLMTTNPAMRRELQAIIRKTIAKARENIVKDARDVLSTPPEGASENWVADPREAYKAVRSSVYKQILGAQVNILSSTKRGAATKYQRHRKLDDNPHQRGGNRRPRSMRTLQLESYHGAARGFSLRFVNAGTADRVTRFGNRGSLRARHWFGTSSAFQVDAATADLVQMIEQMLDSEFKLQ